MTWLVVGATGTLGRAVMRAARARNIAVAGAARSGSDISLDATDPAAVAATFAELRPEVAINCAALADVAACADDPARAFLVNTRAPALLAEAATAAGARLVHISTDHYFVGGGARRHDETAPVQLVNDYARSKFAGDAVALTAPGALVVRTNLTGWRGTPGRPTFIEWAVSAIESGQPVKGFADYFTSTIDATTLAEAILDLATARHGGLLNVAAREVASKLDFLRCLALRLGRDPEMIRSASVSGLVPRRAESCGLDVGRAARLLADPLPDLDEVVRRLLAQRPGAQP